MGTREKTRRTGRATVAALVTVVVFVSATTLAAAAPAAPAPGGWKTVPGVRGDFGQGIAALGWASGRVWMAVTGAGLNTMSVTSARVAGRGLREFETTRLNTSPYVRLIAGSELVYSVSETNADSLVARQLLPTGRLGPPTAPLDPKPIAPNRTSPRPPLSTWSGVRSGPSPAGPGPAPFSGSVARPTDPAEPHAIRRSPVDAGEARLPRARRARATVAGLARRERGQDRRARPCELGAAHGDTDPRSRARRRAVPHGLRGDLPARDRVHRGRNPLVGAGGTLIHDAREGKNRVRRDACAPAPGRCVPLGQARRRVHPGGRSLRSSRRPR